MRHEAIAWPLADDWRMDVPGIVGGYFEGFCAQFFANVGKHLFVLVDVEGAGAIDHDTSGLQGGPDGVEYLALKRNACVHLLR